MSWVYVLFDYVNRFVYMRAGVVYIGNSIFSCYIDVFVARIELIFVFFDVSYFLNRHARLLRSLA